VVILEDLKQGSFVRNLVHDQVVEIVQARQKGSSAVEITYKDAQGFVHQQIVLDFPSNDLEIVERSTNWSFDADAERFILTSEAYRIHLAHLFDPYVAVHTSLIEPLPHQITAVYQEMLTRQPLRYVLADDPGAGKTIMTGLLLKELIIRGDVKRCLIVTPGNLVEQWQDELLQKFNIRFTILTNEAFDAAASGNVFTEVDLALARLDKLSRNDDIQNKLKVTDWDLIVVDEAHKMSATVWGGDVKRTKRYDLGRLLSSITRNYLLLTATPHNGKEQDFQLFMSLIDADRFEGGHKRKGNSEVSDLLRRLVKEELLKFDGKPLFPERLATTVNYDLSVGEKELYSAVTEYVRTEFNRASNLSNKRRNTVGFALTVLQRRLASSPEAIYQSLKRRKEKLQNKLSELKAKRYSVEIELDDEDLYDLDDAPESELEEKEEELVNEVSAARTIEELDAEIQSLAVLERMAQHLRARGTDRKWDQLSKLLQDDQAMRDPAGDREKLIIFTEHRDTLRYLTDKVRSLLGRQEAVVNIYGGMAREKRREIEQLFRQDKDTIILIATDAAGEGINLQRAHLMINYDLPWNPNRLEQRFGRIHRIGQTEVCHLWNLVAKQTREGQVFQRLFEKLEQERESLGGKVFDVLGRVTFDNKPLKDLLIEAIRYGNDPKVRAQLNTVIDNSLDHKALVKLLDERALSSDTMGISSVISIKKDMDRMEAHKLQPHYIKKFFLDAFLAAGGRVHPREAHRYELTYVPPALRNREQLQGYGRTVLSKYQRICFDKDHIHVQGKPIADFICPGHPLLDAVIDFLLEKQTEFIKRGTVLVDDTGSMDFPRLLLFLESAIQDGILRTDGRNRIISRQAQFVEIDEQGNTFNAGYAPYLDYRSPGDEEAAQLTQILNNLSFLSDAENLGTSHAIESILPEQFAEVQSIRIARIEKIEHEVYSRLTYEVNYWDARANELREKEKAGKTRMKLNSQHAQNRADNLAIRKEKRLSELKRERQISALPPIVVGGAVIIPSSLLSKQAPSTVDIFGRDRKTIELIAMNAVMAIEEQLGFRPTDVGALNKGYDIESEIPTNDREVLYKMYRFIEVKGRTNGATTVTVTKNEILTSFNKPEQYILALVEIDESEAHVTYLIEPFSAIPDESSTSTNFDIATLKRTARVDHAETRSITP